VQQSLHRKNGKDVDIGEVIMSDSMNSTCIDVCSDCHQVCLKTAMNHCLDVGGEHTAPEHFKLMLDCAKICATAVAFQLSSSPFSAQLCEVCAKICEACANSCEALGDMAECVEICRKCAKSCAEMAA